MLISKEEKLLTHFRGYLVGRRYYQAQRALDIMMTSMEGMIRKDGVTPVWAHSLSVAAYTRNLPIPDSDMENIIIVALLHDVVEDTEYPSAQIKEIFGNEVWTSVKLLTKNSKLSTEEYYKGIPTNALASIVKGADRIHNLSTMTGVFSTDKVTQYIQESQNYVLPMLRLAKHTHPQYNEVFEGEKHIINLQIERELSALEVTS